MDILGIFIKKSNTNMGRFMSKGRRRFYRCKIPVEGRFLHCGKKKADKSCLKKGIWGDRCPFL